MFHLAESLWTKRLVGHQKRNPVMSVKCFQDVMNEAVTVIVNGEVEVKMAPLCGQFLIKLDTWNDRNASTDKDAEDMLFILKNYLDIQLLYQKTMCRPT